MLALESLGRRLNDERPAAKFAKTPNYADDVKWLHSIAQRLGKAGALWRSIYFTYVLVWTHCSS
jgi:hypothetical protein